MALTLAEATKLIDNPLQRGVVQTFAETSAVLQYLPFMDVAGNAYSYNREKTLPGAAFRNYNVNYTESTGTVEQVTERLFILGGVSAVDHAIVKTQGNLNDIRAIEAARKAKATAFAYTKAFFKGDNTTNQLEFDGLDKRLSSDQVITPAGTAFTLDDLDAAIDAVTGEPTVLFMNKATRRQVNKLMRAAGQAVETVSGVFGQQMQAYAGIPIGIIEVDASGNSILEDGEIYAVHMGEAEFVAGLQAGTMEVVDLGLRGVQYELMIDWPCSMAVFNPAAAAKLEKAKKTETPPQTPENG